MRYLFPLILLLACRNEGGNVKLDIANGDVQDSDNDGLSDSEEIANGTDPNDPDSDDDGIIDSHDPDSSGEESNGNGPPGSGGDDGEDDGPGNGGPGSGGGDEWEEDNYWGNVDSDDDYLEGTCCYELRMRDSYADGWNGAYLTVKVGNKELIYAMEYGDDRRRVDICADDGLDIDFFYTAGNFEEENRFAIVDPYGDVVVQEGPDPSVGLVYNEEGICTNESPPSDDDDDDNDESENDTDDTEEESDDEDLWDWGEPESSDSFDETYAVILYVANSSGYTICQEDVSITIQNEALNSSVSCTTSTGLALTYALSGTTGPVYDSGQGYGYGYPEGTVELITPAGATFTTDFSGECYNGTYVGMFLWWNHTVQTPSGTRYYDGYLYTDY